MNNEMNSTENNDINSSGSKTILLLCRQAPYGRSLAKESIDVALATAVYEQPMCVLFMDDGVFQLIDGQQGSAVHSKDIHKALSAFPLYGVEPVFACEKSLQARSIDRERLPEFVEVIDNERVQTLIRDCSVSLCF